MESTLRNMVLSLFVITLIAGVALGGVYELTKGPIEASGTAATTAALSGVLPEFDNSPSQDTVTFYIDGIPAKVYTAKRDGETVGYAVQTATKKGFSGEIKLMAGFKPDGEIYGIEVLEHNETPGLGSKITDPDNVLLINFRGRNPANLDMRVTKDGGGVDVITASTISSRAYADAVERAYRAYKAFRGAALGADVEMQAPDPVATVLPAFDNIPGENARTVTVDGARVKIYTGTMGRGRKKAVTGYAVESSAEGYGGTITLMVGFRPDMVIENIHVVRHSETPGYGARIDEPDNALAKSFIGKNADDIRFALKSEGGDVDALSGATSGNETETAADTTDASSGAIAEADSVSGATATSNAYVQAVKHAHIALKSYLLTGEGGDE